MTDPTASEPAGLALLAAGANAADRALARELQLPILENLAAAPPLVLSRASGVLQLGWSDPGGPGPVRVDLLKGATARRLRTATNGQPLPRAAGVSKGLRHVLDATAGLGQDTALLAALGCQVTAVERHPVLAALLRDGLQRAGQDTQLAETVQRITVHVGDARELMQRLPAAERPETVLLDPMFPKRGSAQVKKPGQLLRALVGTGTDPDLLDAALACARRRVVVKRQPHTPPLGAEPDMVVAGTRVRYDVYLVG